MDKILHDPKDPKLWELWYIPYYGSCRILSINRSTGLVLVTRHNTSTISLMLLLIILLLSLLLLRALLPVLNTRLLVKTCTGDFLSAISTPGL